jgi:hypothetical protein
VYRFSLHIDKEGKKLSKEGGFPFGKLGELLVALSKCIESTSSNITLVEIEDGSYAPVWETDSLQVRNNFIEIHKDITDKKFEKLPNEVKQYADFLNKSFFNQGFYIAAYQKKEDGADELITQLKTIIKEDSIEGYHSRTAITGKIVQLSDPTEHKPTILVKNNRDGRNIKLIVNSTQETEIKEKGLYKKPNIRFKIRLRKEFTEDKIEVAKLLGYSVPIEEKFKDTIEKAKERFGDIFDDITDPASYIKKLRGGDI